MKPTWRRLLAVLAGVITGGIVIFLMETIGHTVIPPPDHVDLSDIDSIDAYMQEAPVAVLLFCGAGLAVRLSDGEVGCCGIFKESLLASFICGTVLLVFSIINMTSFYHPVWVWIAALAGMVPAAWYGGRLGIGDKPAQIIIYMSCHFSWLFQHAHMASLRKYIQFGLRCQCSLSERFSIGNSVSPMTLHHQDRQMRILQHIFC